ncbi:hypothetical protein [Streptomyces sp. NPDC001820]|uniref:hypothetical protein n=1 Tax=Streptomyces sp. NPDC001820 TaxID=3364613 RepID=UPI003688325B
MRQRTAVVATALTLAIGLTAGCGGEGGGDSADKPRHKKAATSTPVPATPVPATPVPSKSVPATPTPAGPAQPAASAPKALSQAQLEKAILAKSDVPGFDVAPMDAPPPQGERADKSVCAPLTAVINGRPEPAAQASAYRQLTGAKDNRPAVSEFLTTHGVQDATTALSRLRAAVEACEGGFRASGGGEGPSTYQGAKALPVAAQVGDDAFAYQVTGDYEGEPVPLVFHVVRSGGTLATFYTANLEGPQTPRIPPALLTAQADKLTKLK